MPKERRVFNEDLEEQYQMAQSMSDEQIDEILNRHKTSKQAFAAMVLLLEASKDNEEIWLDDWECHLGEIIWPDIIGEKHCVID